MIINSKFMVVVRIVNNMNLKTIMAVGIGGVIGTLLRYTVSLTFMTNSGFPLATLLVNLSGCFILSFILTFSSLKWKSQPLFITAFNVGVIGSFTTFSTFVVEVAQLLPSHLGLTLLYASGSLVGGIICAFIGYYVAHTLKIR